MKRSTYSITLLTVLGSFISPFAEANLTNGLSAHYKLDGNAIDETGHHHGVTNGMSWIEGVDGQAASFNGISDYITMGQTKDLLNSTAVSISFWVNFDVFDHGELFVSYNGGLLQDGDFILRMREKTNLGFNFQYGTGPNQAHHRTYSNAFSSTDVWHHVVCVMDNTQTNREAQSTYYVDGVEIDTTTSWYQSNATPGQPIGNTTALFRIGHWDDIFTYPRFWAGKLDEVRIYTRVLESNEVQTLHTEFAPDSVPDLSDGLSAYYKLDGNALDETGNHNGVTNGMSWVPGVDGLAGSFNGISDYITMGETRDLLNSLQVSMSFWVNFDVFDHGELFVSYNGGSLQDGDFMLRMRDKTNLGFNFQYGTGPAQAHHRTYTNAFTSTDVWYHVVCVMDNTQTNREEQSSYYVDGVKVDTTTSWYQSNATPGKEIGNTSAPFRMGHWDDIFTYPRYWKGQLDEVRIYNRVLQECEIKLLSDLNLPAVATTRSDPAVFDKATGNWHINFSGCGSEIINWGWENVEPVSGDYNGDGINDLAVFDQSSGYWYIREVSGEIIAWKIFWGWPGVRPVSGDYDGDGIDDLAIFDQDTGKWFIRNVKGEILLWEAFWGWPGVDPVSGDFDNDGINDLAIFDQDTGRWFIRNVAGTILSWEEYWGWPGVLPLSGDFNSDGRDDLTIFDQNSGRWFVKEMQGSILIWEKWWGFAGCTPLIGDYDNDGQSDLIVYFEPAGTWYFNLSTDGETATSNGKGPGFVPVTGDYGRN